MSFYNMAAPTEHTPETPYGCVATWGPMTGFWPDLRVHVCTLAHGHDGEHSCACGEQAAA